MSEKMSLFSKIINFCKKYNKMTEGNAVLSF